MNKIKNFVTSKKVLGALTATAFATAIGGFVVLKATGKLDNVEVNPTDLPKV